MGNLVAVGGCVGKLRKKHELTRLLPCVGTCPRSGSCSPRPRKARCAGESSPTDTAETLFVRQLATQSSRTSQNLQSLMQTSDLFNILIPIRFEDIDPVWIELRNRRFKFGERTYTYFTASRDGLHVTIYERGPKVLVQGNGALDFVESVLGPLIGARVDEVGSAP